MPYAHPNNDVESMRGKRAKSHHVEDRKGKEAAPDSQALPVRDSSPFINRSILLTRLSFL